MPRHSTILAFADAVIHESDPKLNLLIIKASTSHKMARTHHVQAMQFLGAPFPAAFV